jgi:glycosyltransferase involved in cell wall biosynthesis
MEVTVCALDPPSAEAAPGVHLRFFRYYDPGRRFGFSPALSREIKARAGRSAIIHNHGLWMYPNMVAGRRIAGAHAKLVHSPRGMLSPWALNYSRRKKRLAWWCGQRHSLRAAHCLHATAESEAEDIRRVGLLQPIAVIPNGIDLPAIADRGPPRDVRRLLFLSRIHPKKGVDSLLRVWRRVQREAPAWELVIAGPDERGHLEAMRRLANELGLERVSFPGPVFGEHKSALYSGSELFILPTHSENFGLVVAEALAHGVPVITTRNAPWQDLAAHRCGWWVADEDEALLRALREAVALPPPELRAMGERGRIWMERDFGWDNVARQMIGVYAWLCGRGDRPACLWDR